MFKKNKECIAMLLAGGQGSRLMVLTEDIAKPAIPYGGKYRIIDFPLSNCINSGIDTVGILTQYQPLVLNEYVGNGIPWGLNRNFGGAQILPPYAKSKKSEWYKGTANAIYQNIHFIEIYSPKYVLILSGDHIYKMDYSKMLDFHKEKEAECTIAVIDVPLNEASRFGIMNINKDNSIYEFEEKPKKPKSTKASMGIYIFTWEILKKYLIADEENPKSSNDFGKNIIPTMLEENRKMFAYPFDGYWKDVGTIESLWEANMDLIRLGDPLNLKDPDIKIYARNYAQPPTAISSGAKVYNSLLAEGCKIKGTINNSVIFTGCVIEKDAVINNSVIMPNSVVSDGAVVCHTITGEFCKIGANACVGNPPEECDEKYKITVVGTGKTIVDNQIVEAGEIV